MPDPFVTPWIITHQTPLSGISQARIWEWVAISFPGDLSSPGSKHMSSVQQVDSLTLSHQGSNSNINLIYKTPAQQHPDMFDQKHVGTVA